MKKNVLNLIGGIILFSSYTLATEWTLLDISMGMTKVELEKKGFKCEKDSNECKAYYSSKYAKSKKDLYTVINSIETFYDNENKVYKILLFGNIRFQKIQLEADQEIFTQLVKKEKDIFVEIKEVPMLRTSQGIRILAIDTKRRDLYKKYLIDEKMKILKKYIK